MSQPPPDMASIHERLNNLRTLIGRVQWILMWTIFAVFHLSLLVVGLFLLWWLGVDPSAIRAILRLLGREYGTIASVLGLGGLGVAAYAYVKAWQAVYFSYVRPFLMKDIFAILGP